MSKLIKDTMNAVVCAEPGLLSVDRVNMPRYDETRVRIQIRRVGICGTDFHIYKGVHPYLKYPRVPGHELSGEIIAVPPGCGHSIGDRVLINPYLSCQKCVACRNGRSNCCVNIQVLGVHIDGGMCDFVDVPVEAVLPAGDLSLTNAAMVEFLAVGAHAIRRGNVSEHDKVLVVGAGPIGLGVGLFSSLEGASVTFLDRNSARVASALELLPAASGLTVGEDLKELRTEIKDATNGDLFNVVIDASGNRDSMQHSLEYVANGGRCVYVSVVQSDITFSDPIFHAKEMTLLGSRNATHQDFEHVIMCMRNGLLPLDKLNTHRCKLAEVPEKLPMWFSHPEALIKGIVHV